MESTCAPSLEQLTFLLEMSRGKIAIRGPVGRIAVQTSSCRAQCRRLYAKNASRALDFCWT